MSSFEMEAANRPSTSKTEKKKNPVSNILDELLKLLRRIWEHCVKIVTCGCCGKEQDRADVFETELMEGERTAVYSLLRYLEAEMEEKPSINEERLRALCILTYSDNPELQKSAALCYAEFSEKMTSPLTAVMMEPLLTLLTSRDTNIQKAASLALSNFALNGPDSNKDVIMSVGAVKPLVRLLSTKNVDIQCNCCGCLTTLATVDANKHVIVKAGAVKPLLGLTRSRDVRIQRNAMGALLNLTHLQSNRNDLVFAGAIPVLVDVLHSKDADVQYYCAAAVSNLAVNEKHRAMLVAVGYYDVITQLIGLLSSKMERVQCQACIALRNLASDSDNQVLIVRFGCLPTLNHIMSRSQGDCVVLAVACLRNLAIHKSNELPIMAEGLPTSLSVLLSNFDCPEVQKHAAGTIRNLAAGEHLRTVAQSGCVEALVEVLLSQRTEEDVLSEVSAALAVLADDDETKRQLLNYKSGQPFRTLVLLAASSPKTEIQYNAAGTIGQVALNGIPSGLLTSQTDRMLSYINRFLASPEPSFVHIALWTLTQLLKDDAFKQFVQRNNQSEKHVENIVSSGQSDAVRELAANVLNIIKES